MDWHFDKDGHFEHRQHIKRSFGGRLDLGNWSSAMEKLSLHSETCVSVG